MQVPKVTTSDSSGHTCNHPCFLSLLRLSESWPVFQAVPEHKDGRLSWCYTTGLEQIDGSLLFAQSSFIAMETTFLSKLLPAVLHARTPLSPLPEMPSLFSSLPTSPWLSPKCMTSRYPRQWQVTQCTHSTVLLPSSSNTDVWQLKSSFQDLAYLVLLYCFLVV